MAKTTPSRTPRVRSKTFASDWLTLGATMMMAAMTAKMGG